MKNTLRQTWEGSKKQTTGSQAAIIIMPIIHIMLNILITLNILIIPQHPHHPYPHHLHGRHPHQQLGFIPVNPVHVSFMSSYMISGLCLLICSHNNFYTTPSAPASSSAPHYPFLLSCLQRVQLLQSVLPTLARCQAHRHPQNETAWEREESRGQRGNRGQGEEEEAGYRQ